MATKKGIEFERETAALAGEYGKRIPKSGAYGTTEAIDKLAGDARWDIPWSSKSIHLECKHGYSRPGQQAKSMTLYREWFDKLGEQAKRLNFFPAWAMKLKFTSEKYVLIPFPVMEKMLKDMTDVWKELEELRAEQAKWKERNGSNKS